MPYGVFRTVKDKIDYSIKIMSQDQVLKVFWKFVRLPLRLIFHLFYTILKIVVYWVMPTYLYRNTKWAIKMFFNDMCNTKLGLIVAVKRLFLFYKLIIMGGERTKSFGKINPDKTFFVIRPYYYMEANDLMKYVSNLLFHYYRNLGHLSYAVNKNWIPVVDWRNYGPFPHQEKTPVNGTMDCWEYYWKQPSEYTLEEVYQSKNVILSTQNTNDYGYIPAAQITSPYSVYAKNLAKKCPQYARLFEFNDYTKEYFRKAYDKLFPENKRVLGVCIRAMAYGANKIANHPIQPSFEELVSLIDAKMKEWDLDCCYVSCEAQPTIDQLKNVYGDKLFFLERLRYTEQPTVENNILYEDGRKYQTNLDYLTEMFLLSQCTCFLGGMSSGTRAAIIWNEGQYEKIFLFDKNNYK
jgi:hypothetical protein